MPSGVWRAPKSQSSSLSSLELLRLLRVVHLVSALSHASPRDEELHIAIGDREEKERERGTYLAVVLGRLGHCAGPELRERAI